MPISLYRAAIMLALAAPALAQTPTAQPANPVAACVASVTAYEREQMNSRAKTGMTYDQVKAGKAAKARECLATLSISQIPDTNLADLTRLYILGGDSGAATATVQRYLAISGTEIQRASRYVRATSLLISLRSLSAAEQLATRLDSLGPATKVQQVMGHGSLLGYYRGIDNDDRMEAHAQRIIALAPSLDSTNRKAQGTVLTLAYTALAAVYGDRAQAPQAIALLTRGLQDLADISSAKQELLSVRERYKLVGTVGAPIAAPHWLNGPADGTSDSLAGHVTILQFSAHWCGPCRKSYPAVTRLQTKYAARGLQTIFATQLYGFFQDRQNLTPAQEIEADREYFFTEHHLPVKLAIGPPLVDPNSTAYRVNGIPHIVILDRTGVIRMIVIGWDPASETRLAAMIEKLL